MKRQPRRGWQRKNSGDASHGSLIFSSHGNFWSSAQGHVVTISSEQCRQVIRQRTQKDRPRHATSDVDPLGRPAWGRQATGSCAQIGQFADENGTVGLPFSPQNGASGVLGFMVPMIEGRLPQVELVTAQLEEVDEAVVCFGELQRATRVLDLGGFVSRPSWTALRSGCRPPPDPTAEFGEWQHGWQYDASSSLEFHFTETVVLAQSSAADQAHLRSHSASDGRASTNAASVNGAALDRAQRDKETKYAELVKGARCHLVVVAIETRGRWSDESMSFVAELVFARSRDAPIPFFFGVEKAMDSHGGRLLQPRVCVFVGLRRDCAGWG